MYLDIYIILLGEIAVQPLSSHYKGNGASRKEDTDLETASGIAPKRGMVLPFTPLAMTFDNVNYFVDMPPVKIKISFIVTIIAFHKIYRKPVV